MPRGIYQTYLKGRAMNVNSAHAIARLQEAALQRREDMRTLFDHSQKNCMTLLMIMDNLYREQGTLTELPQILGQYGLGKWGNE